MVTEVALKFQCNFCDYITCKKSSYDKHILTRKHLQLTKSSNLGDNGDKKFLICNNCNKNYQSRNGLWKHQKICNSIILENEYIPDKKLIMMLIKQNSLLCKENNDFKNIMIEQQTNTQNIMMEVIKNGTNNNSHNITNSHNKSFNLNVFLNETCKDAMNINDFVDSIQLQVSDLENVGKLGFVNGISNIIVKNLNLLDETKRPIHCSDSKREVMYIKDENKWERENDDKKRLRKAIKRVANKNSKLLPEFREKYPDCNKSVSKYSDQYNKLIIEAMGGLGDNDLEKEDKIIKNIAKEVTIDKSNYI